MAESKPSPNQIRAQPGPQEAFLASPADLVIYGGAAGGGKTFALLMEPLRHVRNPRFSAVIFRRTSVQVRNPGGLWDESMRLYPLAGASPREYVLEWEFASGASVKFSHMEHEKNRLDWQGSQIPLICCEENTPIRMADGTTKPLRLVQVGDVVDTLKGGRAVTAVGLPRLEDCVRVTDGAGREQVHSITHEILTDSGWVSYSEMCKSYEPRLASSCAPIQFLPVSGCGQCFRRRCPVPLQPPDSLSVHQPQAPASASPIWDHLIWRDFSACTVRPDQGTDYGLSLYGIRGRAPLLSTLLERGRRVQRLLSMVGILPRVPFGDAAANVRPVKALADCQCHYSTGCSRYDALARMTRASDLMSVLQLSGAVLHIPTNSQQDDRGKAQRHNPYKLSYVHPYTGEAQTAEADHISYCTLEMTPIGKRSVIDITVDDTNHYISQSGLVNKNCFDELTHFTRDQFFYMLSRNRSTCGVRPYIRATCNPVPDDDPVGGWIHEFVGWYIGEDGYAIPERSGVVRWFAVVGDDLQWAPSAAELREMYPGSVPKSFTFILSTVYDNPKLLQADPGYLANLMALPLVDRERLLGGNWRIKPAAGKVFDRAWFEVVGAAPAGGRTVRFWDLAATEKSVAKPDPDFTAGVLMRRVGDVYYVLDAIAEQASPGRTDTLIRNTASQDGQAVVVRFEREGGASGVRDARTTTAMLAGYDVRAVPPQGDKVMRAKGLAAQAEAGNVKVVRGPWNDRFLRTLHQFPDGAHDDAVDAASGAFNELARGPVRLPGSYQG